ncbi:MAG: proton extrusion protein PcxA [Chroococcales cyanobacterium]
MKLNNLVQTARNWFSKTPDRALDQAYGAALRIKAIEDEHFEGKKVSSEFSDHSESVVRYFQEEVKKHLNTIKVRMAEFKASRNLMESNLRPKRPASYLGLEERDDQAIIIEKLDFIDTVINKYKKKKPNSLSLVKVEQPGMKPDGNKNSKNGNPLEKPVVSVNQKRKLALTEQEKQTSGLETVSDKTGLLPRSILRTLNRIRQDIDPQTGEAEEEVLKNYRKSRDKTYISIRFILILIIIPLLVHQVTKLAIDPFVQNYFQEEAAEMLFINEDLEEEALLELHRFKENLEFKKIIGVLPDISPEEIELAVKEKAEEIAEDYQGEGINAIENIFADIISVIAFVWVLLISKREIQILKSFMDEIVYGLSDSAKAFLIILFTDIFVGYHSPHGWEVILEGMAHHFGLPENREFSFLFIATFPVILDTVLKYWIFRYLNRISPSAVATYRNMNE